MPRCSQALEQLTMSEDAFGSVVLLRNAAAHAGHIKQELAAIIQVCCM